MYKNLPHTFPLLFFAFLFLFPAGKVKSQHSGFKRVPWTTSRITGSPEPAPAYRSERVFPKLTFRNPVLITAAPFDKRMVVCEQGGKAFSFPNDPGCDKADLMVDLAASLKWDAKEFGGFEALYGLAFHPGFAENRKCYLCYVLRGKNGPHPQGTRVSQFLVDGKNKIDVGSEKLLLTWLGGGHNGGDLHFGPDGMLYISTGDATEPAPPDKLMTGQDISDLLSSILRIDVDREGRDAKGAPLPYAIPADNPFVNTPKARGEVWAYGFRNPWRMGFDRPTGDLWVGDVGWELYEMVYRVRAGGNYGWSVMEGPQVVNLEAPRGPTPISPPDISFPHTDAASITGGFVYRGTRLKELQGHYICGDWVTRRLWASRFDNGKLVSHREIARTEQQIIAFGLDHDNELYFLDYKENGAGIYRLVPNEAAGNDHTQFPRKLSETGLYESTVNQKMASGAQGFLINAPRYVDGATAQRHVALPGMSTAKMYDRAIPIPETFFSGQVFLPKDGVLVKTLSLPLHTPGGPAVKPVETQILHFDGKNWNAYTYAWNEAATDGELVAASGREREIKVADPSTPQGFRAQTWRYLARTQCLTCHNPWAGYALAFTPMQLDRPAHRKSQIDPELTGLKKMGFVEFRLADGNKVAESIPITRLTDPLDNDAPVDKKARSYLHANCSHCHQSGAGGTATIDLRYQISLAEAKVVGVKPVQGAFDLPDAALVIPGDPYRSVLYYRMAKSGSGHMPHLGAEQVDPEGLELVHDWILKMQLDNKSANTATTGVLTNLKVWRASGGKDNSALGNLLSSPLGGLVLARDLDAKAKGPAAEKVAAATLAAIGAVKNPGVRDLLERFLAPEQRMKRLGSQIDTEKLLVQKGDPARGKEIFFQTTGPRCAACHRVEEAGSTLGPDLSGVGKKYNRAQILEHIVFPSRTIDPKFATQVVETDSGKLVSGILARRDETEVVLRTPEDKEIRVQAKEVLSMRALAVSQMPEMLLRDLTAQQAADLLEYLAGLKKENAPGESRGAK